MIDVCDMVHRWLGTCQLTVSCCIRQIMTHRGWEV